MKFKDYYRTLGVARDAGREEIKRAYRRLARRYHPDVSKEPDAEERFKEVQEAHEVLKDPEKRAAYDRFGADWKAGQEFRPPPDWDPGSAFGGGFTGAHEFSDFFETLFGRAAGRADGRSGPARGYGFRASRGEDVEARATVALEDAYHGATRTITVSLPQADLSGRVVNRSRTLKVRIPEGITEGQRIRLAGQGRPGSGGAASGDLYLEIAFARHRLFRAEGRDIHLDLPVAPWEAALGRSVRVPTLGGAVDLRIPAGSQSGARLRLKGRGLPGSPPGDQYVTVQIVAPPADSPAARALYERMEHELAFDPRAELGV